MLSERLGYGFDSVLKRSLATSKCAANGWKDRVGQRPRDEMRIAAVTRRVATRPNSVDNTATVPHAARAERD
jgi:hypothetical protein